MSSEHERGRPRGSRDAGQEHRTLADVVDDRHAPWRQWARNALLAGLATFVLLGLTGTFDLERESTGSSGALRATVSSPRTTRAGQDIDLSIDVEATHPLNQGLTVRIDPQYLALFEDASFAPEPESQTTAEDGTVVLSYALPRGNSHALLTVQGTSGDSWTPQTSGTLNVAADGAGDIAFELRTWRLP